MPASIVIAPINKSANVSGDVVISCTAVGNLPIYVKWFNETKQMTKNSRIAIETSTEPKYYRVNSTLTVRRLVLEDTRQYSCKVENTYGNDWRTFRIKAQRKQYSCPRLMKGTVFSSFTFNTSSHVLRVTHVP